MGLLNKKLILESNDIPFKDVPVPEWTDENGEPGIVRIAGLDAEVASAFGSKMVSVDAKGNIKDVKIDNFMAEILALTIVDENFVPLFNKSDVQLLGKKSAAVMKRLSDIALSLSGLSEKSVEDATKNSNGTPGEDSPTD